MACPQGKNTESQDHRDTKIISSLRKVKMLNVSSAHRAEAAHFSDRQQNIPESSTLKRERKTRRCMKAIGSCCWQSRSAIPPPLPDAAHLCIHDAICLRVTPAGSPADGTFWLGNDPADLRQVYARRCTGCWRKSRKNLLGKLWLSCNSDAKIHH